MLAFSLGSWLLCLNFLLVNVVSQSYIIGTQINLTYTPFVNTTTVDLGLSYNNVTGLTSVWIIGSFDNSGHILTVPNLTDTVQQLLIPPQTTGNFFIASKQTSEKKPYLPMAIYQPLQIEVTSYTVSLGTQYVATIPIQSDIVSGFVNGFAWMADVVIIENNIWKANGMLPVTQTTSSPTPKPIFTSHPTHTPTMNPTRNSTRNSTANPTASPTPAPTVSPTPAPTASPTSAPTVTPPTTKPTRSPTTHRPTKPPTTTASPTLAPTTMPPTVPPVPTVAPTTTMTPTTMTPTTMAPTTMAPTTMAPTTMAPTTMAPTTMAPIPTMPPIPTVTPTMAPTPTLAPTRIIKNNHRLLQMEIQYTIQIGFDITFPPGLYHLRVGITGMYRVGNTTMSMTFYSILGAPGFDNTQILLYNSSSISLWMKDYTLMIAEPMPLKVNVGNSSLPLVVGLRPLEMSSIYVLGCAMPFNSPAYNEDDYNTFGWLTSYPDYSYFPPGNYSMGVYWCPNGIIDPAVFPSYSLMSEKPYVVRIVDNPEMSPFIINSISTSLTIGDKAEVNLTTAFNSSTLLKYNFVQMKNKTMLYISSNNTFSYDSTRPSNQISVSVPDEGLSTEEGVETYINFMAYDCYDQNVVFKSTQRVNIRSSSSSSGLGADAITGIVIACVLIVAIASLWYWTKPKDADYQRMHQVTD